MNSRKFPIGIANFRSIRTEDYYYVDKTPPIEKLISQGRYYFLSRPRRFGKSLLLDTMLELFKGSEPLFQGLHIHQRWDWSTTYPVVRLSFGSGYSKQGDLESYVINELAAIARSFDVPREVYSDKGQEFFKNILRHVHEFTGKQAVVLVDEYDKPILDAIDNPKLAESNRNYLQGLYGTIKDSQQHLRFVFITGITMFSKVSLFSALNNLKDISLDPRYSSICGYTEHDLDNEFASELEGLDRDQIRHWYNGYSWCGEEKVYNPWAILNLLDGRKFKAHWSATGMPSFLYKVMMERRFTPLDVSNLKANENFISTIDVGNIGAEALMFQSGYLTITGEHLEGAKTIYELDYPNLEVRESLNDGYLEYLFEGGRIPVEPTRLLKLLETEDFVGFEKTLRTLFSAIPHEWHAANNRMGCYEGWYCSVLYSCLWDVVDTDIHAEESSSRGRSDLAVILDRQVFVFECKMLSEGVKSDTIASDAIEQIRGRGYSDKYRDGTRTIHLIGAVFDAESKNLSAIKVERR